MNYLENLVRDKQLLRRVQKDFIKINFQHMLVSAFWIYLSSIVMLAIFNMEKLTGLNFPFLVILLVASCGILYADICVLSTLWTNEAKKLIVIVVVSSILVFAGRTMLLDTYKTESLLNQNYGDYRFSLRSYPENYDVPVYNLLLYYDFHANEGNLSFETNSDILKDKTIKFGYPDSIKITNISISGATANNKTDGTYYNVTLITIDSFKLDSAENKSIPFLLKLQSKSLEPKGKFVLESSFGRVFNQRNSDSTYRTGQYFYKTMEFNLGDYNCGVPCYEYDPSLSYVTKDANYLRVLMPNDYYAGVIPRSRLYQAVSLNTINELSSKLLQDKKNVAISFMIGGVLLFIGELADFIKKFTFSLT